MEKERGVILEEINMRQDMPMSYVGDLWEKILYGSQPAGWLIIGEKENILNIKRDQVLDYFKSQYALSNTVFCIAGNIGDDIIEKVEKYFTKHEDGSVKEKQKVREKQEKPNALLFPKKTDQTHFCLGVRGFDMFSPKRFAQLVLATILGGNMSSRIFVSVREKAGLAYYVHTTQETYTDSGYLVTQAGVAHKNAKKAIELILKEYEKMKKEEVGQKELQKAKEYIKGVTNLSLETSNAQASFYATQEILKKEIISPEELYERIEKVGASDVLEVAKNIFQPQNLNLALIGPFKLQKEFEKILKV